MTTASFIASEKERSRLRDALNCGAVEMNLYGLAVVCSEHQVPHLALRIVSDFADSRAPGDFTAFLSRYTGDAGAFASKMISEAKFPSVSPDDFIHLKKILPPPAPPASVNPGPDN